jgi:aspartyl-tRNA(Asn)/glutamyl-tRNA(Gln) amidotransferase subunit A
MRQHLDRISALNRDINAIVTINDRALEAAGLAEAALMREDRLGPLHGVPFTAKDSLNTVGIRTMRGSRLFANYVPDSDATAVARLKAAGAILLAKTNLPRILVRARISESRCGSHRQPLELRPNARRIKRRRGGGDRSGNVAARYWE